MIRVFLDSSVLFAAAYSATGDSREVLLRSLRGEIEVVISDVVIEEVRRNLNRKAASMVSIFVELLTAVDPHITSVSAEEVAGPAHYTEWKDAPIVAAAIKARVNYIFSLDSRTPSS